MRKVYFRLLLAFSLGFILLTAFAYPASAQEPPPICFWSDHGPVAVERAAGPDPEGLLAVLLAGPTSQERARGIWSAIPAGTTLAGLELALSDALSLSRGEAEGVRPSRTVVVRLEVPFEALRDLDHETFEVIVHQIGWTLDPLGWQDLRIQTWDPIAGQFVPLAEFLPRIPAPRKETVSPPVRVPPLSSPPLGGTEGGQPPAPGQGQPQGALSGRTVYVSAGHGWLWYSSVNGWRTQRPPYPNPPYVGPIIEDHNNAEAVNQYLLQYLWNAGAQVWTVRERDMNEAEQIVNNDDITGYAEEGTWTTSSFPGYDPNVPGHTYRYTTTVAGTATATATWTTVLPADGRYAVYVWYRPGANRASDARYVIHHAGGDTVVTVNQRHHGLTWHYVGTYGFRAGEEAQVTLTNQSSVAGKVVIADAVRFGGGTFDDLTGIDTIAPYPPDEPWWEVGAYYYTQRMGMDAAPGDVTARPIYARWEHAGTGDDAVYVSWHTNGISGYQWTSRGTISIIHNGEGNPVTPGSEALRDAIHTELVHDIQVGWDPTWPGYHRSMNLGELRELWDDDPEVALPGALIEIAYHDHPDDTDALKEPTFQLLVARAIYQGILHYFDPDGVELPEPPTHLVVRNVGEGRVRVSWRPSPTDTVGLVGDPATGYRVYTSTDGLGWSDGVPVVATTVYTLTALSPEQLLFVRITATNAGGESFPTETLAVRVGDGAGVLLVNGFDRLNRTMLVPDYYPPTGEDHLRMFLDRMNCYDYVVQHGEVISYSFDSGSNEAVQEGLVDLDDYALVDWILGEESAPDETLDATERALLADFMQNGGALFLSGTEVGFHLVEQGGDPGFYTNVLRAGYVGDDAGTYEVAPAPGSIFEGLPAFRFDAPGMYDADYPDQVMPINGSTAALVYQGGAGGTAAVQYENGCERLVYFGFPFETVWPAQRPVVMGRVLGFLDECMVQPPQTAITSPVDGAFYQQTPGFGGTASGGDGVTGVEVTVCRQADGLCWDGTAWVSGTVWLTATGSANWTYPLPDPLEEGWYDLQARARDSQGQMDATPAVVSFHIVVLDEAVFLPLVVRQAGDVCTDVIVNGGFETDEGWTLNYRAVYDTTEVHSGAWSLRVGIPPGEPGEYAYSSVAQAVTLPTGSAATLRLWVYPIGEGNDPDDGHYVVLFDQWGGYHALDNWQSNAQTWEQREYDLSAYLGQTVTLYVGTKNNGDDDTAAMYVDDVVLEVCP